jgi:hypothetical protein
MQVDASGAREWSRLTHTDMYLRFIVGALSCSAIPLPAACSKIREEWFLLPPHAASLEDLEGYNLVGSIQTWWHTPRALSGDRRLLVQGWGWHEDYGI